jgi:hypothetical protein
MLSKCANPECSSQFRYLHQSKIFLHTPSPEVPSAGVSGLESLNERVWLCDRCCRRMKVVWAGRQAKLVPLRIRPAPAPPSVEKQTIAQASEKRAAAAAGHAR